MDLINREELRERSMPVREFMRNNPDTHVVSIRQINKMPTIDAEPVRRGRWDLETSKYLRRCSACEKVSFYRGAGRHYDFCPQCGAKMDVEVKL